MLGGGMRAVALTVRSRVIGYFAAIMVVSSAWHAAIAADYPQEPIHIVIAIAPGSSGDLLLRQITPKLGELLGKSVIVDNRGGGGGLVGTNFVAKAAPDGYTLLFAYSQTVAVNPSLYRNLPYDPVKDLAPIARVASQPLVFVDSKTVPATTVPQFLEYARAHSEGVNYASSGNGTSSHLAGAYLAEQTKIHATHVPYNSVPQAFADLARGDIAFMMYPYISLLPVIKTNSVNVLAVTGPARSSFLPDVPSMVELGYPGFVIGPWYALYGPAGMPKPIAEKISAAIDQILHQPDLLASFSQTGTDAWFCGPDELGRFTRSEIDRYRELVRISGAKAE